MILQRVGHDLATEQQQKQKTTWEFPGGLVVNIPYFHCFGSGSVPCQGTQILQAMWGGQNINK